MDEHPNRTSGALCPLETPRFLCDEMLRGLGGWLRLAGYDTTVPVSGTPDRTVLAQALREGRWLITRDRDLTLHRHAAQTVLCLDSNSLEASIRELTHRLNLDWLHAPFSRCKQCNTPLRPGDLPGSNPINHKPPVTSADVLCHCIHCQQAFWEGSHVRRMREKLGGFNHWRW